MSWRKRESAAFLILHWVPCGCCTRQMSRNLCLPQPCWVALKRHLSAGPHLCDPIHVQTLLVFGTGNQLAEILLSSHTKNHLHWSSPRFKPELFHPKEKVFVVFFPQNKKFSNNFLETICRANTISPKTSRSDGLINLCHSLCLSEHETSEALGYRSLPTHWIVIALCQDF